MEQHPDDKARPQRPRSQDPRSSEAAEHAMRDFKQQLGLDDNAWRAILMSVREPSWDPRGEGRR